MPLRAKRINPDAWTKERFLEWCDTKPDDAKYEFDGVGPVAMAPATVGHNEIARNIREKIRPGLPPGCQTYGPQAAIETVGGALREPDAFIACSAVKRSTVIVAAPVIVFEVVSPGKKNRQRDEIEKAEEYEMVPTILRYVVVESENRGVRVFWREPGEREWRREAPDLVGPLLLPEFGIALSFDEIYKGAEFG